MGTVIVEADSAITLGSSYWSAVGAGTLLACLDDSSDATYCRFDAPGTGDGFLYVRFFPTPAPALAFIESMNIFVRDRVSATAAGRARQWYFGIDTGSFIGALALFDTTEVTTTAFGDHAVPLPTDPLGQPWTQETANAFAVAVNAKGDTSNFDYDIAEMFIAMEYNEVPAPVILGPTSPETGTSKPTFSWSVNDPDGDAQNRYQLVIRNDGTSTIVYDTGIQFGNVQSHQITTPLPNGNYDVTLRLGDAVNPNMSPFTAIYNLTITAPLPGTPILVAAPDPALNRVAVVITNVVGSKPTSYFGVERSDDGGVTWRTVQDPVNPRGAVWLNDAEQYLSVGDFHDFTGTVPFTVEVKMNHALTGFVDILLDKASTTDGWGLSIDSDNSITFIRRAASVTNSLDAGVTVIGRPHTVSATYDGTNMRLYLDGVIVGSPLASSLSLPNTATSLTIGARAATAGIDFFGAIEEVRIWSIARTAPQILADINADLVGNETGLVDLWKFDEGSGLSAFSSVTGGHTATLVNDASWTYSAWKTETFYDYTAPLDTTVLYRAYAVHDDPLVFTQSLPSATDDAQLTYSSDWLKSIADPSLNLATVVVGPGLSSTMAEDIAVYEALGREFPIIFGGTVRGEYFGRVAFIAQDDEEAEALEAIRATKSVVLLQTCFGDGGRDQLFLRLGRVLTKTRLPKLATGTQHYRYEIEAWEVEAPTSQGQ